MIKKILIGLGVVIAVAVGIAAFQSPNYKISRDILIAASPSSLFPYINHSQKMGDWMPWKESDAQMVMSYAGPSEGVGSVASWDSPGPMGTGKSEIVESIPGKSVTTRITYLKPMEMTQNSVMSLEAVAGGTKVTWAVDGQNALIGRVMCLFMNMDKMVGSEFTKGLTKLKAIAEAPSKSH